MEKKKILITYPHLKSSLDKLNKDFELIYPEKRAGKEEIVKLIADCDGFLSAFDMPVDKEIIDAGKKLKIISNYAVGFNNIDVDYATKKGIVVTNTPDPVTEPTAEITFGLMIAAARKIALCDRKLRDGTISWGVFENFGVSMNEKTLGIVGMGRIGQAIARRAVAFRMKVVYSNRNRLPEEIEKMYDATYLPMEELLAKSDYVSINTPLTPETHHLMNEKTFSMMKTGAIFVNASRGAIVDELALVNNLKNGKLLAAALDVFEHEPYITPELLTLDNVVMAPHNGTATKEAREDMARFAFQNISRFFEGRTDIARVF